MDNNHNFEPQGFSDELIQSSIELKSGKAEQYNSKFTGKFLLASQFAIEEYERIKTQNQLDDQDVLFFVEFNLKLKDIELAQIVMQEVIDFFNQKDPAVQFTCRTYDSTLSITVRVLESQNSVSSVMGILEIFEGTFQTDQSIEFGMYHELSLEQLVKSNQSLLEHLLNGFKTELKLNIASSLYDKIQEIMKQVSGNEQGITNSQNKMMLLFLSFLQFKFNINLELNKTMLKKIEESYDLQDFLVSLKTILKLESDQDIQNFDQVVTSILIDLNMMEKEAFTSMILYLGNNIDDNIDITISRKSYCLKVGMQSQGLDTLFKSIVHFVSKQYYQN